MVDMVGADHNVLNRLRRDFGNGGDQVADVAFGFEGVGNQNAVAGDDDEAIGDEYMLDVGHDLESFVDVDVGGELGHAREVRRFHSADVDVGGADRLGAGRGFGRGQ